MISTSTELKREVIKNGDCKIIGFFPIDKPNEHAHLELVKERRRLDELSPQKRKAEMKQIGILESAVSKIGKKKYLISCDSCESPQGYVYARDDKLTDWCDFHYINWSDGEQWYGCFIPQVSPIDSKLCLRCCCGQDTRDFRANMTLSTEEVDKIEDKNKRGRNFGINSSKFNVREYISNINLWPKPLTQM